MRLPLLAAALAATLVTLWPSQPAESARGAVRRGRRRQSSDTLAA